MEKRGNSVRIHNNRDIEEERKASEIDIIKIDIREILLTHEVLKDILIGVSS